MKQGESSNKYHCGAFNELARIYQERDKATCEWKERGKKIIGCLGNDVPEEILIAAGYLPVRISSCLTANVELANRYLELAFDPVARSQFQRILDGTYSYLDQLIISNSTDILVRLYIYLRQIRRMEPEMMLPDMYFIDWLFTRSRTMTLYNRDRVQEFKRMLEIRSGQEITPEDLKEAIKVCNENRRLLRELAVLRVEGRITGVDALKVIGAAMFMPKQEHSQLLTEFLGELKNSEVIDGGRIYITGSVHQHTDFYELVESAGGLIVGEDHDWGNRHSMSDIDLDIDPVKGIVDRYHLRLASPKRSLVSERIPALVEQVRATNAQGVIFFLRDFDDAASWDYPEQRKALEALGIPSLLLTRQPYFNTDEESKGRLSEFVNSLRVCSGRNEK